eukprot:9211868-Lingulodinium_polyedra.AAC.1
MKRLGGLELAVATGNARADQLAKLAVERTEAGELARAQAWKEASSRAAGVLNFVGAFSAAVQQWDDAQP